MKLSVILQRMLDLIPGFGLVMILTLGIQLLRAQGISFKASEGSPGLTLTSDKERLPTTDGVASLTATLLDENGQPIGNAEIIFTTTLGTISPETVITNPDGMATTILTSGNLPGNALISAHSGDYDATLTLTLETPVPSQLTLQVGDTALQMGEQTSVNATIQDQFSRPFVGEVIVLFGSYGVIDPASQLSDANGQITATFTAGEQKGTGMISVLSGSLSQTASIQITGAMDYSVFLPMTIR